MPFGMHDVNMQVSPSSALGMRETWQCMLRVDTSIGESQPKPMFTSLLGGCPNYTYLLTGGLMGQVMGENELPCSC